MIRLFFLLLFASVFAKQTYGNLSVKRVLRVHDGDTFIADVAGVHPLIGDEISIRVKGIDAPEITDARVKEIAIQARDFLEERLKEGWFIELGNVQRDKYFRILADVFIDGVNVGEELIQAGLARPYDGKTKSDWSLP
ncbi:MAG: thermonuclease family protein [Parachlamydiales bacterium]|nr:thermonuclease family protein [Parachlamydiales bacterium]